MTRKQKALSAALALAICVAMPVMAWAAAKGKTSVDTKLYSTSSTKSAGKELPAGTKFTVVSGSTGLFYKVELSSGDTGYIRKSEAKLTSDDTVRAKNGATKKAYQFMLKMVNEERAKQGLKPLKLDSTLSKATQKRAKEMPKKFEHTRPDGSSFESVFKEVNYTNFNTAAENISAGSNEVQDTVKRWMDSPGHRANILNKNMTKVGMAYYESPNSEYEHYWVMIFSG